MIYKEFEEKRKEIQSSIISRSEYFNKRFSEIEFTGKLCNFNDFKESKKEEIHLEYKEHQSANSVILSNVDDEFKEALFDEYGTGSKSVDLVVFESLEKGSYYNKELEFSDKIELAESIIEALK